MTGVGFLILFGLSFVLFPCQAQIISPLDGTKMTFLNGSNATITWSFKDPILDLDSRIWRFTSTDGSFNGKRLARISDDEEPRIFESGLSGVGIVKPATLILKNVNQTHDGRYRFNLGASKSHSSEVRIFIAKKPNATLNCSSPITLYEGDDFTCPCRGEGGNPPANVTWYKDSKQFDETIEENNTLTLSNVDGTYTGNYTCEARSHTNDEFADEKSIYVQVYFEPNTTITFEPETAVIGSPCTVTCDSSGFPAPSHTITHNGTQVSTNKTYTIHVVKWSDAGIYKCFAKNVRGNDSASANLTVTEPTTTTNPPATSLLSTTPLSNSSSTTSPPTSNTTSTTAKPTENAASECNCSGTEWYIVVVSLVSGIIIGLFVAYFLFCVRRHFYRNKKPKRNPELQTTEVDTTYQELDLTKMNKEDNYQSLRVNAAASNNAVIPVNDDESAYTELNRGARDDENNYQSLT